MNTLYFDIETRSALNIRVTGDYRYATNPTTQPLCLAYAVDEGDVQLWLPTEPPPVAFLDAASDPNGWRVIAHNFAFERGIFEHVLIPRSGFMPIPLTAWHCSQRLALANSYPAELGLLAAALGLPYAKDPAAKRAMLRVTRPKANRKRKPSTVPVWNDDPSDLALLYERCKTDVLTTRAVWNSPKLRPLSENERRDLLQDATINGRGIPLDRAFATAARDLAINERIAVNLKLAELTDGAVTSVDQRDKFLAALNARGADLSDLARRTVEKALAAKPDDHVRWLLELRRTAARASVTKFKRLLDYASPADDRLRGTLRIFGCGPGRWSSPGVQLQNLKRNDAALPLSLVDSVRNGDRDAIAKYGSPLALLGDLSRASLCAVPGHELKSGDFSAIESVVLAWLSGEQWKLDAYREFQRTSDLQNEPYQVIARKMLYKPVDAEISKTERQLGKAAELACGYGGSVGAWRKIVHHDPRGDDEIQQIVWQWRDANPATTRFWRAVMRAVIVAMRTGAAVPVQAAQRIFAAFAGGNLTITLPSGRAITYPDAQLVPSKKFEDQTDVEFSNNAKGQWRSTRVWFGTFVENIVQGTARDLLAAAIDRCESRGLPVVSHCHDEATIETPIGALSDADFLAILLERPAWAAGLPLAGHVHSGPHYLEAPEHPVEPLAVLADAEQVIEQAIDAVIEREDVGEIDDPIQVERDDDADFIAGLPDAIAPLYELVTLPLTADSKTSCPFHEDAEPSCAIFADHYHCFGCGAHGDRMQWLTLVEGMTEAEAVDCIKDWPAAPAPASTEDTAPEKLAFVMSIWNGAQPLIGSMAEQYLDRTRGIDFTKMPADLHASLRFHPACVFGSGKLPCLLALMRDPITDAPLGIQRVALKVNGSRVEKIERRMLGRAGVIKFWRAGAQLVAGEGLETVLAAATRIPYCDAPLTPAWAALSAKKLAALPVIPGVERLVVLVDNDLNQEGQRAAAQVTTRWRAQRRAVVPLMPAIAGSDWNDAVVMEDARAA